MSEQTCESGRGKARELMRCAAAAGLLAIGACSESHLPTPDPPSASGGNRASAIDAGTIDRDSGAGLAGSSSPPKIGGMLDAATLPIPDLSADAVVNSRIARSVLYSWTRQIHLADLIAEPILLTRSEAKDGKRTRVSASLATLGEAGDPLAKVLSGKKFQKGRFGWPNAWATALGRPEETYGDRLLRIVLKPEAWIAVMTPGSLRVIDMNDAEIESRAALADPGRIGAVFFTDEGDDPNACDTSAAPGCGGSAYREYFINNESMVLDWSFSTQAELAELERSIVVITALRDYIANEAQPVNACDFVRTAHCAWKERDAPSAESPMLHTYRLGLALATEKYAPTLDNLNVLRFQLGSRVLTNM